MRSRFRVRRKLERTPAGRSTHAARTVAPQEDTLGAQRPAGRHCTQPAPSLVGLAICGALVTMENRSAVDNHALAAAILHQAVTADEIGNSNQALELYQEGIERLLAAVHEEQNEARQAKMRTRAIQCLDRAEELRQINRIEEGARCAPQSQPAPPPHDTSMPRHRLRGLFPGREHPPSASEPEQLWLRTADGRDRSTLLVVPDGEIDVSGRPLVVMLHGAGGSSRRTLRKSRWDLLAKREGFVVAVPDGTAPDESRAAGFVGNRQTWNSCAGSSLVAGERSAEARGVDDVSFLVALIADVGRRTRIDPRRVFLAGHSNGAGVHRALATYASARRGSSDRSLSTASTLASRRAHANGWSAVRAGSLDCVVLGGCNDSAAVGAETIAVRWASTTA